MESPIQFAAINNFQQNTHTLNHPIEESKIQRLERVGIYISTFEFCPLAKISENHQFKNMIT